MQIFFAFVWNKYGLLNTFTVYSGGMSLIFEEQKSGKFIRKKCNLKGMC